MSTLRAVGFSYASQERNHCEQRLVSLSEPPSSTHTLVAKSRACISRCCGLSSVIYDCWEGKCSEILATPSYLKNPRVNKENKDKDKAPHGSKDE